MMSVCLCVFFVSLCECECVGESSESVGDELALPRGNSCVRVFCAWGRGWFVDIHDIWSFPMN